jgi:hypothetical protein
MWKKFTTLSKTGHQNNENSLFYTHLGKAETQPFIIGTADSPQ